MPTTTSTPFCSDCDLRLEGPAAVDGLHADAALRAGGGQVAGDLDAQLTGGDDDQRLRNAVATLGRGDDALQHRDAEAEGLAGAGAGLADEVVAGQRQREGQLLDGERAGDPGVVQCRDDVGVDVEVAEQRAVGGDGGATQLLDLRLELLGGGGAGLGVLERDGLGARSCGRGGRRGRRGRGCSRWRSVLSPLVCWGTGSGGGGPQRRACPRSVVAGSVPAPTRPADRAKGVHPGESPRALDHRPRRAASSGVSAQIHKRAERLADSMVARAPVSLGAPRYPPTSSPPADRPPSSRRCPCPRSTAEPSSTCWACSPTRN